MSNLVLVLLIGAAVFVLMAGAVAMLRSRVPHAPWVIGFVQHLSGWTRRWEAPPEGRAWWQPVAFSLPATAVVVLAWMAIDLLRGYHAPLGTPTQWTVDPIVMRALLFERTVTAISLFGGAAACMVATVGLDRSVMRGLVFMVASIGATTAAYAAGTVLVLQEPYPGRLILLGMLRMVAGVQFGIELLLNVRYLRMAIVAPGIDAEAHQQLGELRDLAREGR